MKALSIALLLVALSACGHTERYAKDDTGICYKHARYWFIVTIENDTNRMSPERCNP